MLPIKGVNPFGLENRTLTFHVMRNGVEEVSKQFSNRKFCWMQIPKEIRDAYGYQWAIAPADNQTSWESLPKYMSKKMETPP